MYIDDHCQKPDRPNPHPTPPNTPMQIITELPFLSELEDDITIIALTGGPASGKTTGIAKLVDMLTNRGYKVLVSPESATKLINAGVRPWELGSDLFQEQVLSDTLINLTYLIKAARAYRALGFKVVIICDRGAMDGKAYTTPDKFKTLVDGMGFKVRDICENLYHAVIHLRTTALGKEEFYSLENNSARTETPEQARELDQKTLEAWQRHHHPRVIDNSTDFDEKINRLLREVCAILGDPEPLEIEQKFLIKIPDIASFPVHTTESSIIQDYLLPNEQGETPRLRARSDGESTSYFYTVKRDVRPGVRFETERMIGKREYEELLNLKDPACGTIKKRRVCFFYENQFVEVDLFDEPVIESDLFDQTPGYAPLALMEIEQSHIQQELSLPPFVHVIRNVTEDGRYSNRALSKMAA